MNNNIETPLIVEKDKFNLEFIQNLKNTEYIQILGNYKLTKKDYNNLIIYSNIKKIDVYDKEEFDYQNDIIINVEKEVEFESKQFKKLKINKTEGYKKDSITITLPFKLFFNQDCLYNEEDEFEKLLKYINNLEILNVKIETEKDIDKMIEIVYKIEKRINKKIKSINCITDNKTIKKIEKLKFLEDERILKIWYEEGINDCTIDEFIIMRKNIDSIIKTVKEKQLSKFEQVICVYDIVKKYKYNKPKDEYSMDGRQLHKIFNTNNIICSGYSKVIAQVLNELGIQTGIYKLITKNGELHTRNIIHIIDEKYNVNYIYSMEPTWESALKEEYAYSLFLTPIDKLKEFFPKEKFREDIDVLCKNKTINQICLRDRISLYQFFNNKDLTQEEINKMLDKVNKKVTLENFMQALINVKSQQGTSKKIISTNVPKIIDYNNNLIKYLNKNIGTNIDFFN